MKKLVIVLALAFCSTLLAARPVPFHASIDTEVTPLGDGPCVPCITLNISGSGQALHMGRVSITGPSQIDFSTLAQTGISTMTAADGSTLLMSFSGTFIPGGGPGDATFFGSWVSISGTGRFQGESGNGTYSGVATGSTGELEIDGTLSSPGKK